MRNRRHRPNSQFIATMKTFVGKMSLVAAAVVSLLPLASVAQNIASRPALVNRGIERLTLLPGPELLSPGRNVPTMAPAPLKLGAAPTFLFSPYGATFPGGGGSIYLPLSGANPSTQPVLRAVPETPPAKSVTPDLLRFDHSLKAPPADVRWQFQPGVRRI
jgi:hypothetical protein